MELKLNDVYKFTYNEKWLKKLFEPYWCFDGQLIVKENSEGKLYLVDTYWGSTENRRFILEDVLEQGKLVYICNLNDVDECRISDLDYYADEDLFDLSTQHRCHQKYYKRKNAEKSPKKMEKVLLRKIESTEHDISWKANELQRLNEKLASLRSGDINIFI